MLPLIFSSLLILSSTLLVVGKTLSRSSTSSLRSLIGATLNSPQVRKALMYWAWFKYFTGFCEHFILPDIVTHCVATYPMLCHPDNERESAASVKWIVELSDISKEGETYYKKALFGELSARVYNYATTERFRITCDWMNYIFRIDDWLDDYEPEEGRRVLDRCLDAMRDAIHYQTTEPAPLLTKSWFARLEKLSPDLKDRMIVTMSGFYDGLIGQAEHRSRKHIATVDEYMDLRRFTIGAYPAMALSEFAGGYFLPDEIYNSPLMRRLQVAAIDHIIWTNDILSYNIEQARGDDHNVVTSLMHHEGMTTQEALNYCAQKTFECIDQFERDRLLVDKYGPELDQIVENWIFGLQHWMTGNLYWHYATARYLPNIGLDIMKGERHRYVKLYPKLLKPEAKS